MDTLSGKLTETGLLGPEDISSGVAALFERAVRFHPEAPALWVPGNAWTYQELNLRANRLAHALIASGVQRGEVVAVAMESPSSLAVAMLGALKAGTPTVFLDLKSPKSRLLEILIDSEAATIVTDGEPPLIQDADAGRQVRTHIIDLSQTRGFVRRRPGASRGGPESHVHLLHLGNDQPAQGDLPVPEPGHL